jgi:capsular polysaccharide biosynthesis protein
MVDWAEGIDIFRVPDVLYIPEYGIPVCCGFVPVEAINHDLHLEVRLGRRPGHDCHHNPIIDLASVGQSQRDVCILGNVYSFVFGHWMEELLKVIVMEKFGFKGLYVFPGQYPNFCFDSLALLGVSRERVCTADKPTFYRAAFFTTTISHFTAPSFPGVVLQRRDRLHRAARSASGVGDRVWVERGKSATGRGVLNKEEVYSCIRGHGFVSVDFGEHTFKNQIAIDRDMRVMLGSHGSAFVHCSFMQNRRKVIEIFSPNHINPSVLQLCLVLQHDYNQMVPTHQRYLPYPYGTDLMVDIDHLKLVLSSLKNGKKKMFAWSPEK